MDNAVTAAIRNMMQMNVKRSIRGFTMTWSVSTLGKHLRIAGIILTSLGTPQPNSKARILTLGTMVLGLAFVPACKSRNLNAPN
jgi:hypothetical protein